MGVPPGVQDFVFPVVKVCEAVPPSAQDPAFPPAKLHETPSGFMLQLARLPVKGRTFSWLTNLPGSALSISVLKVQCPSSRSLMISMIRPSTGPWGTPVVPGLQLGFVLHLMTA